MSRIDREPTRFDAVETCTSFQIALSLIDAVCAELLSLEGRPDVAPVQVRKI